MKYHRGHPLGSKADTAGWIGCSIEQMDAEHDPLHRALCAWAGVPSHSMRVAAGDSLNPSDKHIADLEENAVLNVQRWLVHAKGSADVQQDQDPANGVVPRAATASCRSLSVA